MEKRLTLKRNGKLTIGAHKSTSAAKRYVDCLSQLASSTLTRKRTTSCSEAVLTKMTTLPSKNLSWLIEQNYFVTKLKEEHSPLFMSKWREKLARALFRDVSTDAVAAKISKGWLKSIT